MFAAGYTKGFEDGKESGFALGLAKGVDKGRESAARANATEIASLNATKFSTNEAVHNNFVMFSSIFQLSYFFPRKRGLTNLW
jgi:flagellar biosynthesis/type III secretory pathway protein FliH